MWPVGAPFSCPQPPQPCVPTTGDSWNRRGGQGPWRQTHDTSYFHRVRLLGHLGCIQLEQLTERQQREGPPTGALPPHPLQGSARAPPPSVSTYSSAVEGSTVPFFVSPEERFRPKDTLCSPWRDLRSEGREDQEKQWRRGDRSFGLQRREELCRRGRNRHVRQVLGAGHVL